MTGGGPAAPVAPPAEPASPAEAWRASASGTSPEQLLYARILAVGMYAGLALLLTTFALYAGGVVPSAVPIDALPAYWTLGVEEFLQTVNANHIHHAHPLTGWWWLGALNRGDYLSFLGIGLLASVTAVCFAGITPALLRRRDWIYAGMAVVQVLILVLAASGLLTVGH